MVLHIRHYIKKNNDKLITVLLGITIGFILWLTLFSRSITYRRMYLEFLWSYKAFLRGSSKAFYQILGNVLLFVPFGLLLPMSGLLIKHRRILTIAFGFALSLGIELTQLLFCVGSFELDDLLNNTLGAVIGYGIYKLIWWIRNRYCLKKES